MEESRKPHFLFRSRRTAVRRHCKLRVFSILVLLLVYASPVAIAASDERPPIEVYLLFATAPPGGGRFIDKAPLHPKLGYIPKEPLIKLNRLKEVLSYSTDVSRFDDVSKREIREEVTVYFYQEDAKKWSDVRNKFFGKRIVFLVDGEVLSVSKAQLSGESVPSQSILFWFPSKAERLKWTDRLEKLKQKE